MAAQAGRKMGITLKTEQITAVNAIVAGNDVFCTLPTGFGKSLIYTILPDVWLEEKGEETSVFIVMPLKSLMDDQARNLKDVGNGVWIFGEKVPPMTYSFILSSPEVALSPRNRDTLLKIAGKVGCLVFDEAHCIPEWGNSFRECYADVGQLTSFFTVPILALSATTTKRVQQEVYLKLYLSPRTVMINIVPDRPNMYIQLHKAVKRDHSHFESLTDLLLREGRHMPKIVIFANTVREVTQLYLYFWEVMDEKGQDIKLTRLVDMYHAASPAADRHRILAEFSDINSEIRVLLATVAFGLGVNVPDVRVVYHWGLPASVLQYWQEAGRCGRDGELAINIVVPVPKLDQRVDRDVKMIFGGLDAEQHCLRQNILSYFSLKEEKMQKRLPCTTQSCLQCSCSCCRCCSRCSKRCQCGGKIDLFKTVISMGESRHPSLRCQQHAESAEADPGSPDMDISSFADPGSPDMDISSSADPGSPDMDISSPENYWE